MKRKPTRQKAQAVHQRLKAQREKREQKEAAKAAAPAPEKRKPGRPRKTPVTPPPANFISKLAAQVNAPVEVRFPILAPHHLADRFATMSPARYEALKASIASRHAAGEPPLIHPIVCFQGKILNGRHRNRACVELGIKPNFIEFEGDYAAAVEYVIDESTNKDESEGQRAWSAAQFMEDLAKGRTLGRPSSEKEPKSELLSGKSSKIAGLRFGVSPANVESAIKIKRENATLFAELGLGKVNVHQALNRLKLKQREDEVRNLRSAAPDASYSDCRIIEGDCIESMDRLEAGIATVIFTDPPYNNGTKYDADPTRDAMEDKDFITWCGRWIKSASRLLAPDGSMFVLIDDAWSDFIGMEMRKAGLNHQRTIVWWETFGNHVQDGLTPCARYIHYYTKSIVGFNFNTDVREESARQQIGDSRAHPDGKIPTTVWKVSRKQGTANDRVPFADAPPQLPTEIPERCILLASNPGDTVIDCFNGNGTTAIPALRNGRKYIGCERSPKYARQSRQWIQSQLAANEQERKAAS